MSRSGYDGDGPDSQEEQWAAICYQGQLASTMRGKRGQAFLRELRDTLDAMPEKRLIAEDLERDGAVCAIGSVGVARGVDMTKLDPEDPEGIAGAFGITHQLVREIEYQNDRHNGTYYRDSPESRWCRMRAWVSSQIKQDQPPPAATEEGR